MFFRDVIGQEAAKKHLINEVQEGRIPHALLLCGPTGAGKFPLALAYARYIACNNRTQSDACGVCPNCVKYDKLAHPDLHFVFPVVKKKNKSETVCDDYLTEWRKLVLQSPYFSFQHWLKEMGAENQQAIIFGKESDEINRKLSLKSSQGGYKIMIIWLPEKMNIACSNKLLKLLEEPPAQTLFLLIAEEPEMILPTILSRTQRFQVRGIEEEEIANRLRTHYGIAFDQATHLAHRAEGSFLHALETIHLSEEHKLFLKLFMELMRHSYQRKLREMKKWSDEVASLGRERQKEFLIYCQRMIRENFIYNFHQSNLVYLNSEEEQFSSRFAPFVNEKNVMGIMDELSEAQLHIEQNVNPKMVFFDFSLKMIVLLVQK
ncbi:MAG: ATP-binding protein [Phocaeicola sp.]